MKLKMSKFGVEMSLREDLIRLNMLFGPFGRTFGGQDYIASVRTAFSSFYLAVAGTGPVHATHPQKSGLQASPRG